MQSAGLVKGCVIKRAKVASGAVCWPRADAAGPHSSSALQNNTNENSIRLRFRPAKASGK